ncbi:hypothetical protein XY58_00920 [Stenotrophomonas maltophilia]|nr:hypothetical protein XY58_00920 [Stenotrophomonas maltophilia]
MGSEPVAEQRDPTPDSPTDRSKLSKAGWIRLRGREPHGCGDRAYMDVLAASPAIGPTPPSHGSPAFDVDLAGQRPALPRVPGGSPAQAPHPRR